MEQNVIKKRLGLLRVELKKRGLAGYLISTTDEYLSEYAPAYAKRLEYITGFAGSNGVAIILLDKVLFFTDGRYLTAARQQMDPDEFEIHDLLEVKEVCNNVLLRHREPAPRHRDSVPIDTELVQYDMSGVQHSLSGVQDDTKEVIAFDPKIFSPRAITLFKSLELEPLSENLIDLIWQAQPARPDGKIYEQPLSLAGQDYRDKVQQCREFIDKQSAFALAVTNPDAVCWLFNIRSFDIEFTPLLLSYAIVTKDKLYVFVNPGRLEEGLVMARKDVEILPEDQFERVVNQMDGVILFDPRFCSYYLHELFKNNDGQEVFDPCQLWKAVKNKTEIECIKQGHIHDAVAVCEFLAEIEQMSDEERGKLTEYDLGEMLTSMRRKQPGYVMDSFPAIVGYQSNGAVIHYRAEKGAAKKLVGHGLLLIDSGGHYQGATTDITRTVPIGDIPADKLKKYRDCYTRVLRGHLALAMIKFPAKKYLGAHLDVLARQFLFEKGMNYAHGTGHGVGAYLSVHEGPHTISTATTASPIHAGMVMSNEPGYYLPGKFGIRIENLMFAKESHYEDFLEFEMLTLIPYCRELIDFSQFGESELGYLKDYYDRITSKVRSLLSERGKSWFAEQTQFSD